MTARVDNGSIGFVQDGTVGILQTRPLDLSIDEMLSEVVDALHRHQARRLVIDSLSGFELALAPTFREEFRESLYRMVTVLTGMGITMMMTAEVEDSYTELRFSPHGTAFLTDAIIMQRYVALRGQLRRIMGVVKVRGSAHSKDLREFEITNDGIVIGDTVSDHDGLLSGNPDVKCRPPARPRIGRARARAVAALQDALGGAPDGDHGVTGNDGRAGQAVERVAVDR